MQVFLTVFEFRGRGIPDYPQHFVLSRLLKILMQAFCRNQNSGRVRAWKPYLLEAEPDARHLKPYC